MCNYRTRPIISKIAGLFIIVILMMNNDLAASPLPEVLPTEDSPRSLYVSTNVIPWGAAVMNAAFEYPVSSKLSVKLPLMWSPWWIGRRHALRTFALQPECRWWLSKPGRGHSVGVHLSAAWFNLRHGDDRYQDHSRPLLGGGISYGYMLPLGKSWGMEFSIGVGYASMRYDRYYNLPNGAMIDRGTSGYFGIDLAGVSFYYNIDLNKLKNIRW